MLFRAAGRDRKFDKTNINSTLTDKDSRTAAARRLPLVRCVA
jgi:hypothetical protein